MKKEDIKILLNKYGFNHIIKSQGMSLLDILDLLNELGYINLEAYEDKD